MALSYPTNPGDIDHLIADDHAVVERLFQHLEAGRGDRRTLVDQVAHELALHAFAEETVIYPLWPELGMEEENADAREEHDGMKHLLVTLARKDPGEPEFEQALGELITLVRHHVGDEEKQELPAFRQKAGADRMSQLGRDFLAAKRKAPTRAHPHAPDGGGIEKVVGALTKPLDEVRSLVSGTKPRLATDASGILDPQAQAVVDAASAATPMPREILEPEAARAIPGPDAAVAAVMKERGVEGPTPVGSVRELEIPDGAGGVQTLRVYTPDTDAGPLPVVMWIHGGGWVLFDLDTYDASCRGVCVKTSAIVVSPAYRRAPEAPFPAAHDDVLAAYRWVREHAAELGGDPARIAIGGESVGGAMAAATALQLAQAGEPAPSALVCVYPLVTAEQVGDSMDDAADARPLTRPLLSWMAMHAFPDAAAAKDPRVDLLGLPVGALASLPPTLVVTAERDVLRSQGQEFARRLQAAGVDVTARHYEGVMHEFFGAAAVMDAAEQAQQEVAAHLRRAFGPALEASSRP